MCTDALAAAWILRLVEGCQLTGRADLTTVAGSRQRLEHQTDAFATSAESRLPSTNARGDLSPVTQRHAVGDSKP
jgi:hypothetical protein